MHASRVPYAPEMVVSRNIKTLSVKRVQRSQSTPVVSVRLQVFFLRAAQCAESEGKSCGFADNRSVELERRASASDTARSAAATWERKKRIVKVSTRACSTIASKYRPECSQVLEDNRREVELRSNSEVVEENKCECATPAIGTSHVISTTCLVRTSCRVRMHTLASEWSQAD